jgi:hypothetical protein
MSYCEIIREEVEEETPVIIQTASCCYVVYFLLVFQRFCKKFVCIFYSADGTTNLKISREITVSDKSADVVDVVYVNM